MFESVQFLSIIFYLQVIYIVRPFVYASLHHWLSVDVDENSDGIELIMPLPASCKTLYRKLMSCVKWSIVKRALPLIVGLVSIADLFELQN